MQNLQEAIQKAKKIPALQITTNGKMLCPFHNERKPSAYLWRNPHHDYQVEFHCFGCGKSMKFETFYKAITDREYKQKEFKRQISYIDLDLLSSRTHLQFLKLLKDKEFESSYPVEVGFAKTALEYLKKRGFGIQTIKKHQIGFLTREQVARLEGVRGAKWVKDKSRKCFLTFPIRNQKGRILTMQFEDFLNRGEKEVTKLNLKGIPKSLWYSQTPDAESKENEEWAVCESIYDALSFDVVGAKAIATLGQIDKSKMEELKEFKHLLLAQDNDENGKRTKDNLAKELYPHVGLREIKYPEGVKDPNELLQKQGIEGIIQVLERAEGVDLFPPLVEVIDVIMEDYRKLLKQAIRIPEEFDVLEKEGYLRKGLLPGLYGLAGIPGVGKTTILNQLADSLAKNKIPTVYFLTEEPTYRLLQRTVKKEGLEHMLDLKTNCLDILLYRRIFEMTPDYTAEKLKNILQGIKLKLEEEGEHHPVFILDSLQALRLSEEKDKKMDIREKSILKTELLYHIAKDLAIPVVFTSFIPRGLYPSEKNERPTVAVFKESGDVEYLIDVGMCLWVEKEEDLKRDDFKVDLFFVKNRFGRYGAVNLRLVKEKCKFETDATGQGRIFNA